MQIYYEGDQASLFAPDSSAGKMCPAPSPAAAPKEKTSGWCWKKRLALCCPDYMYLDLTPGNGNLVGGYRWEIRSPSLGVSSMLNTGVSPRDAVVSFLSQILEDFAPERFYLSRRACRGILRRARARGKRLPVPLYWALRIQAGLRIPRFSHDGKRTVPAGFLPESSTTARDIGYQEECAPTLKAGGKSAALMLPTLCLNDQGSSVMDCTREHTGTLRAQEHGHQPLVFGNHSADTRFTGPHSVLPAITAQYGTGGNNTAYCITGNAIDRRPENGVNGLGIDEDVAFTMTATDRHAVFSRQRVDVFKTDHVASTESSRQHKDATDLVLHPKGKTWPRLIRRMMPVECERLQGFPDGWTDLPSASDSARYKALGNSVAIPCVTFLLRGVALVLRDMYT